MKLFSFTTVLVLGPLLSLVGPARANPGESPAVGVVRDPQPAGAPAYTSREAQQVYQALCDLQRHLNSATNRLEPEPEQQLQETIERLRAAGALTEAEEYRRRAEQQIKDENERMRVQARLEEAKGSLKRGDLSSLADILVTLSLPLPPRDTSGTRASQWLLDWQIRRDHVLASAHNALTFMAEKVTLHQGRAASSEG